MKVTFMGNHKEWRKVAKRERRRKLRIKSAISRDNPFDPESLEYGRYVKNLEALEMFELAEIENQNHIENEKWVKAEQIAIRQWQQLQAKLDSIRQKELKQKEKLKMEYEQEQLKIKETKDRLQKIKEENERKQLLFMKKIEEFLDGASDEPPPELLESEETKPGCEPCPFFAKTAVCRFGDNCSRNHKYCRISNTLLAANMFGGGAAPGADALEAGAGDARRAHRDFYADVLPEFQKYGTVVQFKVCSNQERHLRGNVYVQFSSRRGALAAWRALHARWYAGRQLALRFCHIAEWKNAICEEVRPVARHRGDGLNRQNWISKKEGGQRKERNIEENIRETVAAIVKLTEGGVPRPASAAAAAAAAARGTATLAIGDKTIVDCITREQRNIILWRKDIPLLVSL